MTSDQKQAVYNLLTTVMMHSGRITAKKGVYWRKARGFLSLSEPETSSAMKLDVNQSLNDISGSLNDDDKLRAFAMIINMAFADGEAPENVCKIVKIISDSMRIPEVFKRLGQSRFFQYEKEYAL